jgi:hypothetical protein
MRTLSLPAAAFALILGAVAAAPAQAAQSAKEFVDGIYKTYVGKNAKGIRLDSARAKKLITPGLMKLIDDDAKSAAKRGDAPELEGDPFIDAQDFEIKSFKVDIKDLDPAKATATVSFENKAPAEKNKPVELDLVKVGDDWRIDDFHGSVGSVRKYLTKKPSR